MELGRNPGIPNIDLVTILANAYENAIYGCIEVKKENPKQECFILYQMQAKNYQPEESDLEVEWDAIG